jgi:hypothetical protein
MPRDSNGLFYKVCGGKDKTVIVNIEKPKKNKKWRKHVALDYDARDTKVAKKLADIQNAPADQVERVTTKALRALFNLGVEQSRRELEWCYDCEGRGYVDYDGLPFGGCAPPVKEMKKTFCACKRGQTLKRNFAKIIEWRDRVL